jgi:protein ImuA
MRMSPALQRLRDQQILKPASHHIRGRKAFDASTGLPMLEEAGLHEIYAAREADSAAALGFALTLQAIGKGENPILLISHDLMMLEWGMPYGAGLAELGLAPERFIHVALRDPANILQAALEGARCKALAGVVLCFRGASRAYDLTASRRLSLTARAQETRIILLRAGAPPMPSAAESRFLIRAAPSQALFDHAPGQPAFDLTLLRHRNGSEGGRFILEWNRDVRRLEVRARSGAVDESGLAVPAHLEGTLSGALVSFPLHRPHPPDAPGGQTGRPIGEPFRKTG